MVTDKIKQLQATKARMATLVKSIATQLNKELAGLPSKYGFDDAHSFSKAVLSSGGKKRGRPAMKKKKGKAAAPKAAKSAKPAKVAKVAKAKKGGKRKRAVITDATREQVKQMVAAGKTGGQISKSLGISMPSVHNIKKALGLVKAR